MFLLFGSTMLLPEEEDGRSDMPVYLDRVQGRLFTFEAGFWAWALVAGPLIIGEWESESYLWLIMVGILIAMAIAKVKAVRLALTAGAWLVQLVFIANEALVLRDIPAG